MSSTTRILAILWLTACLCFSAVGDYTSARVRPDGFTVAIKWSGFTSGQTATFGYRARVRGSTSGSFSAGDTMTQAVTSATCKFVSAGTDAGGAYIIVETGTGIPNFTSNWTNGANTFTPANMCPAYTIPGPNTPYVTRTSLGYTYGTTTASSPSKNIPLTRIIRYPRQTYSVAVSSWTGTFEDGETVSQAVTGAVGIVVGNQSSGPVLYLKNVSGGSDNSNIWTGGTSMATATASGAATVLAFPTNESKDTGTDGEVLCGLAEYVWSGNTGTLTTFSGNFVNAGGSSQLSAAVTAGAVTNGSTLGYPTQIVQFDNVNGVCTADMVNGDFYLAVQVRYPALPLNYTDLNTAAVRFDVDGASSLVNWNATVPGAAWSKARGYVNGYWTDFYRVHVPASTLGLTNGELLNCRARVYSTVGDNVFDSNNYTVSDDEWNGGNKQVLVWNETNNYAYVNASTGVNPGTVSTTAATAQASPFLNIGESYDGNTANVIRLEAGTHNIVGNAPEARRSTNQWIIVEPAPGETWQTVTVNLDTIATYKCARLMFRGLTVALPATNCFMNGEDADNFLRFYDCHFTSAGVAEPNAPFCNGTNCVYIHHCYGDLSDNGWNLGGQAGGFRHAFHAQDTQFSVDSASTGYVRGCGRLVGCDINGGVGFSEPNATNPVGTWENAIYANNVWRNVTGNSNSIEYCLTEASTRGIAITGNSFERITSAAQGAPLIWVAADNGQVNCNNVLIADNTMSGDRNSIGYSPDQGSALVQRRNWCLTNSVIEVEAAKADDFRASITSLTRVGTTATATLAAHNFTTGDVATITSTNLAQYNGSFVVTVTASNTFTYVMASDPGGSGTGGVLEGSGNRVGGWAVNFGANRHGWHSWHLTGLTAAGQFVREFPGINSFEPAFSQTTVRTTSPGASFTPVVGALGYVSRRTAVGSTAGLGNSELSLIPSSPAFDTYFPKYILSPVDFRGHTRQVYGPAGAYVSSKHRLASAAVTKTRSTGVSAVMP